MSPTTTNRPRRIHSHNLEDVVTVVVVVHFLSPFAHVLVVLVLVVLPLPGFVVLVLDVVVFLPDLVLDEVVDVDASYSSSNSTNSVSSRKSSALLML